MLLTEQQAKTKRCAFGVADCCLASGCMSWGWERPEEIAHDETGNEVVATNGGPPPGDGWVLSTDPSDVTEYGDGDGFDQIWRRPDVQFGYCARSHAHAPTDR